jgi:multiple sugar transport system substrate-binding protein
MELTPIVTRKAVHGLLLEQPDRGGLEGVGRGRRAELRPPPAASGSGREVGQLPEASQFFSVTTQAKQPKEAAMFIDFIHELHRGERGLLAERGVPISSKVQLALKPKLGRSQAEMFGVPSSG